VEDRIDHARFDRRTQRSGAERSLSVEALLIIVFFADCLDGEQDTIVANAMSPSTRREQPAGHGWSETAKAATPSVGNGDLLEWLIVAA
jgi:hypothetical protein